MTSRHWTRLGLQERQPGSAPVLRTPRFEPPRFDPAPRQAPPPAPTPADRRECLEDLPSYHWVLQGDLRPLLLETWVQSQEDRETTSLVIDSSGVSPHGSSQGSRTSIRDSSGAPPHCSSLDTSSAKRQQWSPISLHRLGHGLLFVIDHKR